MLKVKVMFQSDGTFPLTEYFCPKCNRVHHFFSTSQKECIKCGESFPNIRYIIEKLPYRTDHYNLKLGVKNADNTSAGR